MRPRVLVFVAHYLPAFKAGGPLRTLANMVEHLSDEFEFFIVTGDRDLGDSEPFASIETRTWQRVGLANVYYLPPSAQTVRSIAKLMNDTAHDVLYLNSFFDPQFSMKPLVAAKLRENGKTPVILAPRGEFSPGALRLKAKKKYLFMTLAKMIGLYDGVYFQASSEHEKQDIIAALHVSAGRVHVAIDLPKPLDWENVSSDFFSIDGKLRIVFLSRIVPIKNLLGALDILQGVRRDVIFDIYGPKEDVAYWEKCERRVHQMPDHVHVRYCGEVQPEQVRSVLSNYDIFLFPTLGENYGHVIEESLSAGTPVLISDQTPWKHLEDDGLGWEYSLDDMYAFVEKIESFEIRGDRRSEVRRGVMKRLLDQESIEANRELFHALL